MGGAETPAPPLHRETLCICRFVARTDRVTSALLIIDPYNDFVPDAAQFNTDRAYPGRWTITFSNPPINMFVPTTIVELRALMTDLEADPSVKVVVFQSANPNCFIAHLDVAKAAECPEVLGLWRELVLRLSSPSAVSIAKIRGRTCGIGNEFVLACDMRFASRQSALFRNFELNFGRYLPALGPTDDHHTGTQRDLSSPLISFVP
jgi:Enoyl-CoA hydratase/isomerase